MCYTLSPTLICDPQNWPGFILSFMTGFFHKNALSNFTITVDLGKAVCFCWLLFSSTVASCTFNLET